MHTIHNALGVQPSVQLEVLTRNQCTHQASATMTVLKHQTLSLPHSNPPVPSSSCQRERGKEDKIRPGYLLGLPSIWKGQRGTTQSRKENR